MANSEDIRGLIRKLVDKGRQTMLAKVASVDENARTCTLDDDGLAYYNVRLQCITSGSTGIVVIPQMGAMALAVRIEDTEEWMLVQSSENKEININGGQLGGLVKIEELVNRLNAIENDINSLKTAFSGWIPVSQDGGAALKTAAGTWFSQQLSPTQKTQIEDTKIKH